MATEAGTPPSLLSPDRAPRETQHVSGPWRHSLALLPSDLCLCQALPCTRDPFQPHWGLYRPAQGTGLTVRSSVMSRGCGSGLQLPTALSPRRCPSAWALCCVLGESHLPLIYQCLNKVYSSRLESRITLNSLETSLLVLSFFFLLFFLLLETKPPERNYQNTTEKWLTGSSPETKAFEKSHGQRHRTGIPPSCRGMGFRRRLWLQLWGPLPAVPPALLSVPGSTHISRGC